MGIVCTNLTTVLSIVNLDQVDLYRYLTSNVKTLRAVKRIFTRAVGNGLDVSVVGVGSVARPSTLRHADGVTIRAHFGNGERQAAGRDLSALIVKHHLPNVHALRIGIRCDHERKRGNSWGGSGLWARLWAWKCSRGCRDCSGDRGGRWRRDSARLRRGGRARPG